MPARGALTNPREVPPILDINHRARQLTFRRKQIPEWVSHEQAQLKEELEHRQSQGDAADEEYFASGISNLKNEARHQNKEALSTYGMLENADPRIVPLRYALAAWGLSADDVGVLSGTMSSAPSLARKVTLFLLWLRRVCSVTRRAAWQMAGLLSTLPYRSRQ